MQEAADALRQAQTFLSDVTVPPDTDDEQRRLTSTLHALDHASRLTEIANGAIDFGSVGRGPEDIRAGELCTEAMRSAAAIAREVAAPPPAAGSPQVVPVSPGEVMPDPRAMAGENASPSSSVAQRNLAKCGAPTVLPRSARSPMEH
jgi:phosphate:Na+ symporter